MHVAVPPMQEVIKPTGIPYISCIRLAKKNPHALISPIVPELAYFQPLAAFSDSLSTSVSLMLGQTLMERTFMLSYVSMTF